MERAYETSCAGKHQHRNRAKAIKRLVRMGRHHRFMQPYHCAFCGQWHIGHQPGTLSKLKTDKHLKGRWKGGKRP